MRQAELSEITQRIEALSLQSALGSRVRGVSVEPHDDGYGYEFLKVDLRVEHAETLDWDEVKPLVRSIEDATRAIDDRFPSVFWVNAA